MIRADGTLGVIAHEGDGITLLDLSNPLSPQVITRFFNADGLPVLAHNIWIEGDYVYATEGGALAVGVGEGGRLSIIDISNPLIRRSWRSFTPARSVLMTCTCATVSRSSATRRPGLVIVDVGNGIAGGSPTNPVEVGRVQFEHNLSELRVVENAWYWPDAGYVFVGSDQRVHVVDVSDLSNPVEVATFQQVSFGG